MDVTGLRDLAVAACSRLVVIGLGNGLTRLRCPRGSGGDCFARLVLAELGFVFGCAIGRFGLSLWVYEEHAMFSSARRKGDQTVD